MKLVSLFDGIGGFPLAFERAGVQTTATVEIDTAAAAVSRRHFPGATQFPDVTEVSADDIRSAGFVPDRGILTAGWPCQDFSVAGRRAGLAGSRSGLWWEVVRLLADLRPRWFIGENVPGLLSSVCEPECPGGCMRSHGGAMGSVLGSLGELGYGVAYRVLDAQHFGVPQRRQRVVIVGHLGAPFGAAAQVLFEPEGGGGDSAAGRSSWPHIAPCLESGANTTGGTRPPGTTVDTAESLVVAPALVARYGKGTDSDATDALIVSALTSNGVGTCSADDNAAQAGHVIVQPKCITGDTTHTLTSEGSDASEDGTGRGTPIIVHPLAVRGRDGGAELEIGPEGGPYNALRAGDGGSSRQSLIAITTPDVAATLTSGVSNPGVSSPGRRQEDDHNLVAFAHTAGVDMQASEDATPTLKAQSGIAAHTGTIVRRLTELECERLQGYPDEWTAGQSGAARYRQLGNSIAVPVFEWVASRIITVDAEVRHG